MTCHNRKERYRPQLSKAFKIKLEGYVQKHKVDNVDEAYEYLCQYFPNYRRKKKLPLKRHIAMHLPEVRCRLRDLEDAHDKNAVHDMNKGIGQVPALTDENIAQISSAKDIGKASTANDKEINKTSILKGEEIDQALVHKDKEISKASYLNDITIRSLKNTERSLGRCDISHGKITRKVGGKSKELEYQEKESKFIPTIPPFVLFKDLGGIAGILGEIQETIVWPLTFPKQYKKLGVQLPRGVILHGPPGCGKTTLANAIATETEVPFFKISAPDLLSRCLGESVETRIKSLFEDAMEVAPCIVFIDEIDAIASTKKSSSLQDQRIVQQLLTSIDDLNVIDTRSHVVVIGATNHVERLDPALRRGGRFDREIVMGIPDEDARERILLVLAKQLTLRGSFDFKHIARRTAGFVAADLKALSNEAGTLALKRVFVSRKMVFGESSDDVGEDDQTWRQPWTTEEMENLAITMQDLEDAVKIVQPSTKREGFTAIPEVTWEDVGSLSHVRKVLESSISRPLKFPEDYKALGMKMSTGVLLYGPPGCGKTLVAKMIANEAGANFIAIKGPELLNMWHGESERAIRQLFTRARASSPCIIFFDEIDAMAPKRGRDVGSGVSDRVLTQLLAEMDGLEQRRSTFVIAATNRPDMMDSALLRPGRFDTILYVPLPDPTERALIMRTLIRKVPISMDVDVDAIGRSNQCDGFSGADLALLVRLASQVALDDKHKMGLEVDEKTHAMEAKAKGLHVTSKHFEIALTQVSPSVSHKERKKYEDLHKQFGRRGSSL